MEIDQFGNWIGVALGVIALLVHAKGYFASGEKDLVEDLEKAESKLIELDRRTQTLEGELKHLPDRDTSHRLEISMERISGRLDTLDEKLKPIDALSRRLQEVLIEKAK